MLYTEIQPYGTIVSGLEALSSLSMLNPPTNMIRAMSKEDFQDLELTIEKDADLIRDNDFVELEIWNYNPKLFSKNGLVDPASLYACLKNEKDERVEQALEVVLGSNEWY